MIRHALAVVTVASTCADTQSVIRVPNRDAVIGDSSGCTDSLGTIVSSSLLGSSPAGNQARGAFRRASEGREIMLERMRRQLPKCSAAALAATAALLLGLLGRPDFDGCLEF